MNKTFCDKCNAEITEKNVDRNLHGIKVLVNRNFNLPIEVEFFFNQNSTQLVYDICMHCIIDAVNRLDDRPGIAPGKFIHLDNV